MGNSAIMYNNSMNFDYSHALLSLCPNAQWSISDNDYDSINWTDDSIEKPTKDQLDKEVERLNYEYSLTEYQRLRAAEYPDFKEYLDGIVKGDQDQIDAYIAACLAVKEKYPKP